MDILKDINVKYVTFKVLDERSIRRILKMLDSDDVDSLYVTFSMEPYGLYIVKNGLFYELDILYEVFKTGYLRSNPFLVTLYNHLVEASKREMNELIRYTEMFRLDRLKFPYHKQPRLLIGCCNIHGSTICVYFVFKKLVPAELSDLLGLLNSRLFKFYISEVRRRVFQGAKKFVNLKLVKLLKSPSNVS